MIFWEVTTDENNYSPAGNISYRLIALAANKLTSQCGMQQTRCVVIGGSG